jgi:hypothetical protein
LGIKGFQIIFVVFFGIKDEQHFICGLVDLMFHPWVSVLPIQRGIQPPKAGATMLTQSELSNSILACLLKGPCRPKGSAAHGTTIEKLSRQEAPNSVGGVKRPCIIMLMMVLMMMMMVMIMMMMMMMSCVYIYMVVDGDEHHDEKACSKAMR